MICLSFLSMLVLINQSIFFLFVPLLTDATRHTTTTTTMTTECSKLLSYCLYYCYQAVTCLNAVDKSNVATKNKNICGTSAGIQAQQQLLHLCCDNGASTDKTESKTGYSQSTDWKITKEDKTSMTMSKTSSKTTNTAKNCRHQTMMYVLSTK